MVKYQTNFGSLFGVIIVWFNQALIWIVAYIIYETLVWEFLDFMIIMKYVDNEYWYTPTDKIVIIEGK